MSNYVEIQSLQRAFDLLDIIGGSSAPLALKEISVQAALPRSSTYRFLRNVEQRGYIRCDTNGKYHLGLKFLLLQQQGDQDFELKKLARPFLERLREATGETVHLGVLFQNRVLYVDSVESPHLIRMVAQIGSTIGVYCTALGKALLMNLDNEEVLKILETETMVQRTESTLLTPDAYLADIERTRLWGYGMDAQESSEDSRCISAPILDNQGRAIGAISISGPSSRFGKEEIENVAVPALLAATSELSDLLGGGNQSVSDRKARKERTKR